MEKTITMQQMLNFKEVEQDFKSKTLPLKGAYKLMKISNALDDDLNYYSENFQKILEIYGAKEEDGTFKFSDDGEQIIIQEGKIEECNNAIEELLGMEITVDNLNFKIEDLGDNIECTPDELEGLMPLFD